MPSTVQLDVREEALCPSVASTNVIPNLLIIASCHHCPTSLTLRLQIYFLSFSWCYQFSVPSLHTAKSLPTVVHPAVSITAQTTTLCTPCLSCHNSLQSWIHSWYYIIINNLTSFAFELSICMPPVMSDFSHFPIVLTSFSSVNSFEHSSFN